MDTEESAIHSDISSALKKRSGTNVKRVLVYEEEDEPEGTKPKKLLPSTGANELDHSVQLP